MRWDCCVSQCSASNEVVFFTSHWCEYNSWPFYNCAFVGHDVIHLHFAQSIRKTKVFLKYWHTEKLAEQLEKAQRAVITIQKGKRSCVKIGDEQGVM